MGQVKTAACEYCDGHGSVTLRPEHFDDCPTQEGKPFADYGAFTRAKFPAIYPRRTRPYFLGFERGGLKEGAWIRFDGRPAVPYRIKGLLVFGVDASSLITRFHIGPVECLKAGREPIPARVFSVGYSFAQFQEMIKQEPNAHRSFGLQGELVRIPEHFPYQEAIDTTVSAADFVSVTIQGPIDQLVTWGIADVN